MTESRDPRSAEEWQAAANAAHFMLAVDGARQFGFITGGPEANVERCLWVLREAAERNIFPEKIGSEEAKP